MSSLVESWYITRRHILLVTWISILRIQDDPAAIHSQQNPIRVPKCALSQKADTSLGITFSLWCECFYLKYILKPYLNCMFSKSAPWTINIVWSGCVFMHDCRHWHSEATSRSCARKRSSSTAHHRAPQRSSETWHAHPTCPRKLRWLPPGNWTWLPWHLDVKMWELQLCRTARAGCTEAEAGTNSLPKKIEAWWRGCEGRPRNPLLLFAWCCLGTLERRQILPLFLFWALSANTS